MADRASSPITAAIWELWLRKRKLVWLTIGIIAFESVFNWALPADRRSVASGSGLLSAFNGLLLFSAYLLVFSIFSYTELNTEKGTVGFPRRLFTLPVSTFKLVALPQALGVISAELLYLAQRALVAGAWDESYNPLFAAVLIGSFMVVYQALLWCLADYGAFRMVALGVTAIVFIGIAFTPSFPREASSLWVSENGLIVVLLGIALIAFFAGWAHVASERSGGGGRRRNWIRPRLERIADVLPRRRKEFSSPEAAQIWYEWRSAGVLLPLYVGCLLIMVMLPLSVFLRNGSDFPILVATLAMPVVLALPFGKGFSKPDYWSADLSVPPFAAVRPLSTEDMVVIRLKTAALSTAISWLFVLAFLAIWLTLWSDLEGISGVRLLLWQMYSHSLTPQYVLAPLFILAGMLLTWSFLVSGLWVGLSGSRKLFVVSALPYGVVPVIALIGLIVLLGHNEPVLPRLGVSLGRAIPTLSWLAAVAVIAKFWIAAFWWRRISVARVRQYLAIWITATLCLVVLAAVLWSGLRNFMPSDIFRLRAFLIFVALMAIPFARLGLAPSFLARNRHR